MRVFVITFICYLVLLSVQPCEDVLAAMDNQGHSVSEITHIDQPADGTESDDCSPFCICSCCSMPVASKRMGFSVTVIPDSPLNAAKIAGYQNPYENSGRSSIWQPPKA